MTNTEKQLKNAKRGGCTLTIAIDEMYKQAIYNVIEDLKEILS